MNWVDIVVISVIGLSALLAFIRGLVREVLGIGSWAAAGVVAVWGFPFVRPRFEALIAAKDMADIAAFGVVFLVALVICSVVSGMIGGLVRTSVLGGLDRTLGVVFGLVRGAAIVIATYIIAGMLVPLDRWPDDVQAARSLPYIYDGAVLAVSLLPESYRPEVHVPPGGRETKAADLLRVNPQGRATVGRP